MLIVVIYIYCKFIASIEYQLHVYMCVCVWERERDINILHLKIKWVIYGKDIFGIEFVKTEHKPHTSWIK
jgi:hypothetical protein